MSNHAASRKHYYTVLLDRTLVCFLLVVVLNFFLPRLLPGNPVAYLTGFSEQDMTPAQVAFYEDALHYWRPAEIASKGPARKANCGAKEKAITEFFQILYTEQ